MTLPTYRSVVFVGHSPLSEVEFLTFLAFLSILALPFGPKVKLHGSPSSSLSLGPSSLCSHLQLECVLSWSASEEFLSGNKIDNNGNRCQIFGSTHWLQALRGMVSIGTIGTPIFYTLLRIGSTLMHHRPRKPKHKGKRSNGCERTTAAVAAVAAVATNHLPLNPVVNSTLRATLRARSSNLSE